MDIEKNCEVKRCSKCGVIKLVEEFYKNKGHKDGLSSECKSCLQNYKQKYKYKEYNQKYRQKYNRTLKGKEYRRISAQKLEQASTNSLNNRYIIKILKKQKINNITPELIVQYRLYLSNKRMIKNVRSATK